MLPSKRCLCLPKLVLVPKRQPGVQMDLTSSELPNEIQKIIREDSVNDTEVDETDGTIVTDFVYEENHMEKKSWKFCNNVTVPRSEVVFMSTNGVNSDFIGVLYL